MKELATFLWKNRLLPHKELSTADGRALHFTHFGHEMDNGKFTDAKFRADNEEHCGNIILTADDSTGDIKIIAQSNENREWEVTIATKLTEAEAKEFKEMQDGRYRPPCENTAATYSSIKLRDFLSRLLVERIEEKAERIASIYESCDKKWDDTLFKLLARSYGFGIQGRAFEEWALALNLQALGKHRNNIEQVEAIMFGQAGLLNEESIPAYYHTEAVANDYYQRLVREYKFLKSKFNLQEMNSATWGYGNSAPHIRIARLAALFHKEKLGTTAIATCKSLEELRNILQSQPIGYWQHHTQFGSTTTCGTGDLNNKQLDVLIINTVIPMLYSYGKHRSDTELCNKAEDFLYEIGAESNSIVRRWTQQGLCINCAADSQALIQLNNAYCKMHRCAECRFAHEYFKKKI